MENPRKLNGNKQRTIHGTKKRKHTGKQWTNLGHIIEKPLKHKNKGKAKDNTKDHTWKQQGTHTDTSME